MPAKKTVLTGYQQQLQEARARALSLFAETGHYKTSLGAREQPIPPPQPAPPLGPIIGRSNVQLDDVTLVGQGVVSIAGNLSVQMASAAPPELTVGAILTFGDKTSEGVLVESVQYVWWTLLHEFLRDREAMFKLTPRQWEEMLAGMLKQAGYDEVTLTAASGDHGVDVIGARRGFGCTRMLAQMKAYGPGRIVKADEVRSTLALLEDRNASKAMLATTAKFAPKLLDDPKITSAVPYRLELLDGEDLLKQLAQLKGS